MEREKLLEVVISTAAVDTVALTLSLGGIDFSAIPVYREKNTDITEIPVLERYFHENNLI